jgi:crossover junction endodeoxyribonuclease RuvC
MIVIGIDPGLTGAVASLDSQGELLHLHDTPVMTIQIGRKTRQDYDPQAMRELLLPYVENACYLFIERQQSMPGQGVSSTFKTGLGFGLWLGIIAALQIPYTIIAPLRWKRSAGLVGREKDASRQRAQQLFPTAPLTRKRDHGRGDALCIAYHGLCQEYKIWHSIS